MVIQFKPSAADVEPSADSHSPSYHSLNWLHDPSNPKTRGQSASSNEDDSKVIQFELACPEEPTLFPNYVEEIKAKQFKGTKSTALFVAKELRAAHEPDRFGCPAIHWRDQTFLETDGEIAPVQSLSDAA